MKLLRYILGLCLLFFVFNAGAQSWSDLSSEVTVLNEKGEYQAALTVAERMTALAKQELGEKDLYYGKCLVWQGTLLTSLKTFDKAETVYRKALDVFKNVPNDSLQSYAEVQNTLGALYLQTQKYELCEQAYRAALQIYKVKPGPFTNEYATALAGLRDLFGTTEDLKKSIPVYKDILIFFKGIGRVDSLYAANANVLAVKCYTDQQYALAEQYYLEAQSLFKATIGVQKPDYIQVLNNLITLYQVTKELNKQIAVFKELMAIQAATTGNKDLTYAATLKTMAGLIATGSNIKEAISYQQEAVEIVKALEGEKSPGYIEALTGLGNLYRKAADLDEAAKVYETIVDFYRSAGSEYMMKYASALNTLGVVYLDAEKNEQAIVQLDKAKNIWINSVDAVENLKIVLGNLSIAYSGLEKYPEAIELNRKILELSKQQEAPLDANNALIFNRIGVFYFNNDDLSNAEQYYKKAIKYLATDTGKKAEYFKSLDNLGLVYTKTGRHSQNLEIQRNILSMKKQLYGANSIEYAKQLNVLAVANHNLDDYTISEPLYKEANERYKILKGIDDPDYLQTLGNHANVLADMKKIDESLAEYSIQANISARLYGDTALKYLEVLKAIGDAYYSAELYPQADSAYNALIVKVDKSKQPKFYLKVLSNRAIVSADLFKYELAIEKYNELIKEYIAQKDTSGVDYLTTIKSLGYVYKSISRYDMAKKYFQLAFSKIDDRKSAYASVYQSTITGLGMIAQWEGKYSEAEQYFLKAHQISINRYGDSSLNSATYKNNLGLLYADMGRFPESLKIFKESLRNVHLHAGELSNESTTQLNNIAYVYRAMGDFTTAEKTYLQVLKIRKAISDQSPNYAISLNNLASLYQTMGQYPKAEALYLEAMNISKLVFGQNSGDYALGLSNMGSLYSVMGLYSKSAECLREALKIRESLSGKMTIEYAQTLENIGALLIMESKINEAEEAYITSIDIRKKILGDQHYLYGESLNALGEFYRQTSNYEKAEPLFLKAIEIYKRIYGEQNLKSATPISNLGLMYSALGRFNLAEPMLLRAMEIWKQRGEQTLDYALSLNNLGALYNDIGQLEKAVIYYKQATALRKQLLGELHPDYGESLSNAAILYNRLGLIDQAEQMFIEAIEIAKKANGTLNLSYAIRVNNLAGIYMNKGDYDKAESRYREALGYIEQLLGNESASYAITLSNIGTLYSATGKLDKAEEIGLQVLKIREKIFGKNNIDYSNTLDMLYRLCLRTGRYQQAEVYLAETGKIRLKNLTETFSILSEKEKGNYLANNITLLDDFNSFLYQYPAAKNETRETAMNLLLKLKSLTLSDTKNTLEAVKQSKDTVTIDLYNKWLADKSLLAKQYALPTDKQDKDLKKIEDRTELMEKELTRRSAGFNNDQKAAQVTYQDVRKKLAKDEAAVEFVSFSLYDKKWTDTVLYAAYLITGKDSVLQFIPLCEGKKLDRLFANAGKNATTMVNNFYRGLEVDQTGNAVLGDSLFNMVWKPLENYLGGIKKINYAPSGKLYAVAFNALPLGNKQLLIDKYTLQQYTSTRDLALQTKAVQQLKPSDIVFFGDASFSIDSAARVRTVKTLPATVSGSGLLTVNRGGTAKTWSDLPGTLKEVNTIKALFELNKIPSKSFIKQEATEEHLKSLSGRSPQILHLATHGFFLPALDKKNKEEWNDKSTYALADDPLMRSGLVLAGGNYAWAGNPPIEGIEDGIATAYEISQLNLNNTDLVVLSACETALGDVKGSEGVFGLQRGFKMAGVKKMIVSLWQVPDKETAELMSMFYAYTFKGKTISEAFNIAQAAMRKKYSPYYWAAFVLIE